MIPYSKHFSRVDCWSLQHLLQGLLKTDKVQGKDTEFSICFVVYRQDRNHTLSSVWQDKHGVELESLCNFTSGLGGVVSQSRMREKKEDTIEPSWSSRHKEQLYPHWVCVCQKYQGCWRSRTYKSMLSCRLNYLDYIRTLVRATTL